MVESINIGKNSRINKSYLLCLSAVLSKPLGALHEHLHYRVQKVKYSSKNKMKIDNGGKASMEREKS